MGKSFEERFFSNLAPVEVPTQDDLFDDLENYLLNGIATELAQIKNKDKVRDRMEVLSQSDAREKPIVYTRNSYLDEQIAEKLKTSIDDFDSDSFKSWIENACKLFFETSNSSDLYKIREIINPSFLEEYQTATDINLLNGIESHFDIKEINYVDYIGLNDEDELEKLTVVIGYVGYVYSCDEDGEILIGSNKIKKRGIIEISFTRKNTSKKSFKDVISDLNNNGRNCANCGALITYLSNYCCYCGSTLFNSADKFCINNIKILKV